MDPLKRFFGNFVTWYLVGYLALIAGGAYLFQRSADDRHEIRAEIARAKAFDDRRTYDICIAQEQARAEFREALINALKDGDRDLIAASQASEDQPKTEQERMARDQAIQQYLARRERSYVPIRESLKPRKCVLP